MLNFHGNWFTEIFTLTSCKQNNSNCKKSRNATFDFEVKHG